MKQDILNNITDNSISTQSPMPDISHNIGINDNFNQHDKEPIVTNINECGTSLQTNWKSLSSFDDEESNSLNAENFISDPDQNLYETLKQHNPYIYNTANGPTLFDIAISCYKHYMPDYQETIINVLNHTNPLRIENLVRKFVEKLKKLNESFGNNMDPKVFYLVEELYIAKLCQFDSPESNNHEKDYDHVYKEYIDKNERGLANYFVKYFNGSIKTPSYTGYKCYIWNEKLALWVEGDEKTLIPSVSNIICPLLDNITGYYEKIITQITKELNKSKNNIKELQFKLNTYKTNYKTCLNIRDKTNCHYTLHNISKLSIYNCVDLNFQHKLNNTPYLLPVKDRQVIDLKSGIARFRTKEDYFSIECPVYYNPYVNQSARDVVTKLIYDLMVNDPDMIDFLNVSLGYAITGDTSMNKFFIFWGKNSNNGSSTLFKFLELTIGDFYRAAHKSIFITAKPIREGSPEPHKVDLLNRRIVTLNETLTGNEKLNEGYIKKVIKGYTQSIRDLYQKQSNVIFNMKPILACENLPRCTTNLNIFNHLILIKFKANFTLNPNLHKQLDFEEIKSAFLLWLIQGSVKFYKFGIDIPKCVYDEIDKYRKSQNPILAFFDECCITDKNDTSYFIESTKLYRKYLSWNINNVNISQKAFSTYVEKKLGFIKDRKGVGGRKSFFGIKIYS